MRSLFTAILSAFLICGCTTTGTTQSLVSDETVKVLTDSIDKLDKEGLKKLKEAYDRKVKDEKTEEIKLPGTDGLSSSTSEAEGENISEKDTQENGGIDTENNTEYKDKDAFPLEKLTINTSVDSPQLIRHYTNGWTTENPWALIKDFPVTVNIDSFSQGGISLSGSTVKEGKYENDKWERTSTFWAFDENGNELGYEDNAYISYPEPGKFYGRAKYILVVSCSDYGDTFNLTGRSRVMEVK